MVFEEKLVIPFSVEQMQKILSLRKAKDLTKPMIAQDPMCVVDYEKSTIKGKFFVNFISNLKISILLDKTSPLKKEDKFELLEAYMTAPKLAEIPTLNSVVCVLLLEEKTGLMYPDKKPIFLSQEERTEFRTLHQELVSKWITFIDSVPLSLMYFYKPFTENSGKDLIQSKDVEIIEDHLYISANVATALITPNFLEDYLAFSKTPVQSNKIFELQMYEPIFDGYSLMSVLRESPSLVFINGLFNNWLTVEVAKVGFI
jgi:hypothetical protein